MTENLKEKTIIGITWSAIDSIVSQGVTFIIGVILARLLSPKEFGTLGIAMLFVGLFNQFVDCGFSNALIRKKEVKGIEYNTSFFFNVAVGVLMYVLCLVFAPLISSFFDNPDLERVLNWISVVILINALSIVQRTILIKNINFKTQTTISLISSITSGAIGIIAACRGCGVMSLVFQQISKQALNSILLWVFNNWKPQLEFSIACMRDQFRYGIKLLLSGLIDFVFNESASIVIGKVYSSATLGHYSRAREFSSIFSSNFSSVIQRVTFPVLSRFQNELDQLVAKYKIMVRCLMLVSCFFMISLACTAESVVLILVGSKWTEAISFLQIICLNDMFYPIKQVNNNALMVTGRSDYVLKATIIKRFFQAVPIALGVFNIYYMLIGLVISSVLGVFIGSYFTSKCTPYSFREQLSDILASVMVCIVPGIAMYIITFLGLNIYVQFVAQVFVGITSFLIIVHVKKLPEYLFMVEVIKNVFDKIKCEKYE